MTTAQHTQTFDLEQPVIDVFPLFSPEGEKRWVPEWDYENVMGSNDLSEDYVFLTRSHDHGTTEAIWLVKRFDPDDHTVEYYKIEPADKVGVVRVTCTSLEDRGTRVEVTYKYIALSETGRTFIAGFTADVYKNFIEEWRRLLLTYFATRR